MKMNTLSETKESVINVMDCASTKAANACGISENFLGNVEPSTIIISLVGVFVACLTYRINTRSTMVSERMEKRELKVERMNDLTNLANVLIRYRELLENTSYPILDSNKNYDIIILFDYEFPEDLRTKEINRMHAVIVRRREMYKKTLIFSYRGEYSVDPLSIYLHKDPGLTSTSSDWDDFFDALRDSINGTIGSEDISDTLNAISQGSEESISEAFSSREISKGSISMSTPGDRELKNAITSVNIGETKRAINFTSDINARDTKGRTFLHYAVGDGFWHVTKFLRFPDLKNDKKEAEQLYNIYTHLIEIINELIDAGANVDAKDNFGIPVIVLASHVGNYRAIEVLASGGADVEATMESTGLNALQVATIREDYYSMRSLISNGASVDVRNGSGETPLHEVLRRGGSFSLAKILIENGADVDAKDQLGVSPRELISQSDDDQLIDLIGDQ